MRFIHILLGTANPKTPNGVNKVVHSIATKTISQGLSCEVWSIDNGPASDHEHSYFVRRFPIDPLRFRLSAELQDALRSLTPETWVQLHSVFIPELSLIANVLKRNEIAYGVTPHGGYLSEGKGKPLANRWKKKIFFQLSEAKMLRGAALIHAIGATEVEDLSHRIRSSVIRLLQNGFDFENQSHPLATTRRQVSPSSIVYCGRLVLFQKGLDLLLKGFRLYRSSGGSMQLRFIGAGPDRSELERLSAELDLQDVVEWKGLRFGDDLAAELAEATVFIHSSRFDVIPTACLEAASQGLPLLVSEETNLADPIRRWKAGWVLRENGVGEIARVMMEVERAGAEECARRGENARAMVRAEFDWTQITRRFIELAEEAAGKGVPHASVQTTSSLAS